MSLGVLTDRYRNDPQIMAMTKLVTAYENNEVHEAERILRSTSKIRKVSRCRFND